MTESIDTPMYHEICISDNRNCLIIGVAPEFYAQATFDDNGNSVKVGAIAGPFTGAFHPRLFCDDLVGLRDLFINLNKTFPKEVGFQFKSLMHEFKLNVAIDKSGHMTIHVILESMPYTGREHSTARLVPYHRATTEKNKLLAAATRR